MIKRRIVGKKEERCIKNSKNEKEVVSEAEKKKSGRKEGKRRKKKRECEKEGMKWEME